jgi:hypothetical protein
MLRWLAAHGFEIANHTNDLAGLTATGVQTAIHIPLNQKDATGGR